MSAGLESVAPGAVVRDKSIAAYLDAHGLSAVVAPPGDCYLVGGGAPGTRERRVRMGLRDLLSARLGADARIIDITPMEHQQWLGRARRIDAGGGDAAREAGNPAMEFLLGEAVGAGASDVYLDIHGTDDLALVSFRRHGFRRAHARLGAAEGLAIARSMWSRDRRAQFEERAPCDCAFDFPFGGRTWRVRANSLPDVRGQTVVARLRDPGWAPPLDACGYDERQIAAIRRMCAAPGGLIAITGAVNSGKSTTLASLVASMPATQRTIEVADPVEVLFEHVAHVELDHYHRDAEERFRAVLAGIVRQSPDMLVLGEIRDRRTAKAAESMSIQGKRVLSTVHTQSCASAIPRLRHLGVDASLLASPGFLAGIVNQNLVPVLCGNCAVREHADGAAAERHLARFGGGVRFASPTGCAECGFTGVAGQTVVAEAWPLCLDAEAPRLIGQGDYAGLARRMRRWGGAKHDHAAAKIRAGLICPAETEKVIGEFADEGADQRVVDIQRPARA